MTDMDFKAPVGDEYWEVKISWEKSINGYQIYIDNYFEGTIVKYDRGWVAHLNTRTILTGDDISVLIGIIENGS
jgi:hypothetical protein